MQRRVFCLVVIVSVLFQSAASAAPDPQAVPQGRRSSTGTRVVWTLIGAGLGFGAGLVFGLRQFDDAIDSDRKVWTSALVGAGAGGVAGALLSGRGAGNNPALGPSPPTGLDNQRITAAFTMEQSATATTRLAERVRSFNATSFNLDRGASVEEPGSPAIPGSPRHAGPAVIGAPPTDLMSVIPRSTTPAERLKLAVAHRHILVRRWILDLGEDRVAVRPVEEQACAAAQHDPLLPCRVVRHPESRRNRQSRPRVGRVGDTLARQEQPIRQVPGVRHDRSDGEE
jgi:hypothetical protein